MQLEFGVVVDAGDSVFQRPVPHGARTWMAPRARLLAVVRVHRTRSYDSRVRRLRRPLTSAHRREACGSPASMERPAPVRLLVDHPHRPRPPGRAAPALLPFPSAGRPGAARCWPPSRSSYRRTRRPWSSWTRCIWPPPGRAAPARTTWAPSSSHPGHPPARRVGLLVLTHRDKTGDGRGADHHAAAAGLDPQPPVAITVTEF